jgi:hypothetical protein
MMTSSTASAPCRMGSWTGPLGRATALMAGAFLLTLTIFGGSSSALANEPAAPWECSGYSGDAHTRCLQAYIEGQQAKISQLEGELRLQQSSVNELRDRVDRQRAATADLERRLSDRSYAERLYAPPRVPYSYAYPYPYPPVGLGFYFGSPGYYGSPFLSRPYFGSGFYFGPRSFGPRHFHCRGRC